MTLSEFLRAFDDSFRGMRLRLISEQHAYDHARVLEATGFSQDEYDVRMARLHTDVETDTTSESLGWLAGYAAAGIIRPRAFASMVLWRQGPAPDGDLSADVATILERDRARRAAEQRGPGPARIFLDAFYGARLRLIEEALAERLGDDERGHERMLASTDHDEASYARRIEALERAGHGNAFAYLAGGLGAIAMHPRGAGRILEGFADRWYGTADDPLWGRSGLETLFASYDAQRTIIQNEAHVPVDDDRLARAKRIIENIDSYYPEPIPWPRAIGSYCAEMTAWMYLPWTWTEQVTRRARALVRSGTRADRPSAHRPGSPTNQQAHTPRRTQDPRAPTARAPR